MALLSNIKHLLNGVDIDFLMREIDSINQRLSIANRELSRYSEALTEKDNEIESLKQQNFSLAEDMNREKNDCSIQKCKVESLSKTIAELNEKCENITQSNSSLNDKNLALTNEVRTLKEKNTQLESSRFSLQLELSEKNEQISTTNANYSKLQSDYSKKSEQLQESKRTLESERSEKNFFEENLAKLQEKYSILSEKYGSLQVYASELAYENSSLKQDAVTANGKIDHLTEECSIKESEKSELRVELDNQKTEIDSLNQRIQKLVAEQEALSPYMYLIEAKKKIKEAKMNLQSSLDSALSIMSTIKHEEVKKSLEDAIKSSRELISSDDCTLEELNCSKENLDSACIVAEEQEKNRLSRKTLFQTVGK